MKELDTLVENYFAPTFGATDILRLVEQVMNEESEELDMGTAADDEVVVCDSEIGCEDFNTGDISEHIISEQMSGQDSERNLVAAIKNAILINGGPLKLEIGTLGTHTVVDAEQMGGGKPEPKADVNLILDSGDTIGLSMKKENFSFFESRMDENKLRAKLEEVDLEEGPINIIVADMKKKLSDVTIEQAEMILEEKKQFLNIVMAADPSYNFPDPLIKDGAAHRALAMSQTWGKNGMLKNPFKIKNIYLHLSDVLGDKYRNFLKLVVSGSETNPAKADGVLIADVPPGITNVNELRSILLKTKSIDETLDYYIKDDNINIKFRLRPITKVRTTYSGSNRSHYKVGERMYDEPTLGVSWTVFAVR